MGYGEEIYYVLSELMGDYAYGLALALAAFIVVLYMLDADEWNGRIGSVFLDLSILATVAGFVTLVLCIADEFPYGMVRKIFLMPSSVSIFLVRRFSDFSTQSIIVFPLGLSFRLV